MWVFLNVIYINLRSTEKDVSVKYTQWYLLMPSSLTRFLPTPFGSYNVRRLSMRHCDSYRMYGETQWLLSAHCPGL